MARNSVNKHFWELSHHIRNSIVGLRLVHDNLYDLMIEHSSLADKLSVELNRMRQFVCRIEHALNEVVKEKCEEELNS